MIIVLTKHKGYKVQAFFDMDGGFWLQKANETTDDVIEGFVYTPDLNYSLKQYGGCDAFVSQVVLPKTNEFMGNFFPKDGSGTEPIPTEDVERLKYTLRNLFKFDAETETFRYEKP